KTVVNNRPGGAAFNGAGGVQARPSAAEEAAAKEQHEERTAEQTRHVGAAKADPAQRASANRGKPAVAAAAKPGELKGPGAVGATKAGAGAQHSAAVRAPNGGAKAEGAGPGAKPAPEKPNAAEAKRTPAARRAPADRPAGGQAAH